MSRSNPTEKAINPAKKWFEWAAKKNTFYYYDKDAVNPSDSTTKGIDINVPFPFKFVVLDTLHTMKGYNKPKKEGYWANEIRDTKKEPFKIMSKNGVEAQGLYENVKGKVVGCKYYKSIYIGFFNENKEITIGNIKLSGTAMSDFMEFEKGKKITEGCIIIKYSRKIEDGDDIYYSPIFEQGKISPETDAKAIELDKVLQEYLTQYFANSAAVTPTPVTDVDVKSETPETDALFPKEKEHVNPVSVSNDFDDDIPF